MSRLKPSPSKGLPGMRTNHSIRNDFRNRRTNKQRPVDLRFSDEYEI